MDSASSSSFSASKLLSPSVQLKRRGISLLAKYGSSFPSPLPPPSRKANKKQKQRDDAVDGNDDEDDEENKDDDVDLTDGPHWKCSCRNPKATTECCSRGLFRAHKMGSVLGRQIIAHPGKISKPKYKLVRLYDARHERTPEGDDYKRPPTDFKVDDAVGYPRQDFRHVLIFRDVYDALVSG